MTLDDLKFIDDSWELNGQIVYNCQLLKTIKREELCELVGKTFRGRQILGIEAWAIPELKVGTTIGVLTK